MKSVRRGRLIGVMPLVLLALFVSSGTFVKVHAQQGKEVAKHEVLGQVVDKHSKPVDGYPISIMSLAKPAAVQNVAVTDSEGMYQVFLPAGRYVVRAVNQPAATAKTLSVHEAKWSPQAAETLVLADVAR